MVAEKFFQFPKLHNHALIFLRVFWLVCASFYQHIFCAPSSILDGPSYARYLRIEINVLPTIKQYAISTQRYFSMLFLNFMMKTEQRKNLRWLFMEPNPLKAFKRGRSYLNFLIFHFRNITCKTINVV